MSRVFIGIGSNLGGRLEHISKAVRAVGALERVRLCRMATIMESEPVGGPPQAPYLNTVVEVETSLAPQDLLSALKALERRLGRQPSAQRWGPRVIDLDILLYDDAVVAEPELVIPHPLMQTRRFVLEPLAQLAPDAVHPVLHQSIATLRDQLCAAGDTPCA